MKSLGRLALPSLLFLATTASFASEGTGSSGPTLDNTGGSSLEQLTTYILNLGGYFGYNIRVQPPVDSNGNPIQNAAVSQNLLNLPLLQQVQNYVFNAYLGAVLVNTAAPAGTTFVPSTMTTYSSLNKLANNTFKNPAYSTPSATGASVSTLIDQPTYQSDPVSQAVLNILATPDYSYCLNNDGTGITPCSYASSSPGVMNDYQVMVNAVGTIPNTNSYFTYPVVQPLLSELNVNSLVSPLMYSTTQGETSSEGTTNENAGLTATTQVQQAANFIRMVSGAILPLPMPNRNTYDNLYLQAINSGGGYSQMQSLQAQAILTDYLAKVRIYAAQSSVALGNYYYIFSKRIAQQSISSDNNNKQTSAALDEYNMATWRLYNPDQSQNKQWISQINNASQASVQKEIAVLLAEMNYQLYLSRQLQERILLTESTLLMQNVKMSQPSPTLTGASTGTSTSTTQPSQ